MIDYYNICNTKLISCDNELLKNIKKYWKEIEAR